MSPVDRWSRQRMILQQTLLDSKPTARARLVGSMRFTDVTNHCLAGKRAESLTSRATALQTLAANGR